MKNNSSNPTKRSPGQKLVSIPMNEKFIEEIDNNLSKVGYSDRSSMIRDAIVEKLKKAGIGLTDGIQLPPQRTQTTSEKPAEKA